MDLAPLTVIAVPDRATLARLHRKYPGSIKSFQKQGIIYCLRTDGEDYHLTFQPLYRGGIGVPVAEVSNLLGTSFDDADIPSHGAPPDHFSYAHTLALVNEHGTDQMRVYFQYVLTETLAILQAISLMPSNTTITLTNRSYRTDRSLYRQIHTLYPNVELIHEGGQLVIFKGN